MVYAYVAKSPSMALCNYSDIVSEYAVGFIKIPITTKLFP